MFAKTQSSSQTCPFTSAQGGSEQWPGDNGCRWTSQILLLVATYYSLFTLHQFQQLLSRLKVKTISGNNTIDNNHCFKCVLSVLPESFHSIARDFQESFQSLSRVFSESFKILSGLLSVFQVSFKCLLSVFQVSFECLLSVF